MSIDPRLLGPRLERYGVDVLDRDENMLGTVLNRISGSVEQNADAKIRGGMSIAMRDNDIDWSSSRFRPWVTANGITWSLGIYLPTTPVFKKTSAGAQVSASCLDKLVILDEFAFPAPVSVPPGTVVTTKIRSLLETDLGESSIRMTDSAHTTSVLMVWPAGTTALRVINDLLESINYSSIWCDRDGRYRVEPYVLPADRDVQASFEKGEASIHSPVWSLTTNNTVPNRVVLATSGTDTQAGLVATSENHDVTDPYSYPARGRWVTRTYENVEASDQTVLDSLADRYLGSLHPVSYLEISHAIVPLEVNDVVRFKTDLIDRKASVNEYRINLQTGALVSGKWVVL